MAGIFASTHSVNHSNVSTWVKRPLQMSEAAQARHDAHTAEVEALQKQIAALNAKSGRRPDPKQKSILSATLQEIVLDDRDAELTGEWKQSIHTAHWVDEGYLHDENTGKGEKSVTWKTRLEAGRYEIRPSYSAGSGRSPRVPVTIKHAKGVKTIQINQKLKPPILGAFQSLGKFDFEGDQDAVVTMSTGEANGHVIAYSIAISLTNALRPQLPDCSNGFRTAQKTPNRSRVDALITSLKPPSTALPPMKRRR